MNNPQKKQQFYFPLCGRKRLLIALLLILIQKFAFTNSLDSLIGNGYGIINTTVLSTTDTYLSIRQLLSPELASSFTPLPSHKTLSPTKTYWYKLDFNEINLEDSKEWVIRFPKYDHITLYSEKNDSLHSRVNGRMERKGKDGPYHSVDFAIINDELIDGRYLLARIQHVFRKNGFGSAIYLHPAVAELDRKYFTLHDVINYIPYLLFIGGMFLMIFYSFGIYFMNRDKLFNYYAIYLLSLVLYLGVRLPLVFGPLDLRYPLFMHIYNELIQVLANICYLLFASFFLNARNDFPKLHMAIRYAIWFLVGIMVLQLTLILSEHFVWMEAYVVQFERYFMIAFSLVAYFHILLNYKNKIVYFLLIGSIFFLAGGIMAMVLHQIKYMMLGAAIEVFIFSLGMGYRIKLVEKTRQSVENEMNKLKLTALRAQMNPHFIFNSLNSIRAYVISNETKKASDYLNKFARLIRLILHYSLKDNISLKDDLDALALYVELEQMRFRDNFGFTLNVASDVNAVTLLVPPLILQPYVENAIVHGLAPSSGQKNLLVEVTKNKSKLCFIIRDNGVGRSYSKNFQSVKNFQHKSVAMELTRKRIELAVTGNSEEKNIKIIDLKENGQPAGTEVRLNLPLQSIK
jgi:sensor histidine kinase YesM